MTLDAKALGLATGIIMGAAIFVATIWVQAAGGGSLLGQLSRFYFGYSVGIGGAFLGLLYGFIDGFIGGWLLALLYNKFSGSKPE
ncbi:MAG TPA: hypothetical protein EYP53_08380 [Candidatus Latescibacteria bacterium]|nr:hypothetical protein [Candidatus Latescibacterota bacterium]